MDFEIASFLKDMKEKMQKSFDSFVKDVNSVRSGQPRASLVDSVMVDCYGAAMPINQLALVSVPDSKTILIEPWDQNLLPEINRSLQMSNLGYVPQIDGSRIRINIPELSQERRQELIKLVRKITEEFRVSVRAVRKSFNNILKKAQKEKFITEDENRQLESKIQDETNLVIKKIEQFSLEKEKKLKTI